MKNLAKLFALSVASFALVATNINAIDWGKQVSQLGAGEIIITSIDKEGTGKGLDVELTKIISESVSIPVIACGGAGNLNHILEIIF